MRSTCCSPITSIEASRSPSGPCDAPERACAHALRAGARIAPDQKIPAKERALFAGTRVALRTSRHAHAAHPPHADLLALDPLDVRRIARRATPGLTSRPP